MVTKIAGYQFAGPFARTADLEAKSGVYVVASQAAALGNINNWLDVGESESVRDRVSTHDRAECWKRNVIAGWTVCFALYCTQRQSTAIEKYLRQHLKPSCGDR